MQMKGRSGSQKERLHLTRTKPIDSVCWRWVFVTKFWVESITPCSGAELKDFGFLSPDWFHISFWQFQAKDFKHGRPQIRRTLSSEVGANAQTRCSISCHHHKNPFGYVYPLLVGSLDNFWLTKGTHVWAGDHFGQYVFLGDFMWGAEFKCACDFE